MSSSLVRRLALAATTAAVLAVGTAGVASAQSSETGSVYAVHGIPDTPVDVYVDGERAIDDFEPGTSGGPLEVPAGSRQVTIFPADAADGSGSPLLSGTADVPAGGNATLVAHLSASGQPTLTPFVNDVSAVPAGQSRLVVRHTAQAPAVDVLAGGQPVVRGITNPNQQALVTDAGTVSAAVAAAGTTDPVIGPADVNLREGATVFVHAIGSLEKKNLELVTFTVSGGHSAPSGVPAGAPSGSPASDAGAVGVLTGVLVLGAVLVSGAALRLRGGRR